MTKTETIILLQSKLLQAVEALEIVVSRTKGYSATFNSAQLSDINAAITRVREG